MGYRKFKYRYLLAFGSNLGHKEANFHKALEGLRGAVEIVKASSWLTTSPLPSEVYDVSLHQDYLNFVADTASDLDPKALYKLICQLEDEIGHSREGKWEPRGLDIDILFWAQNLAKEFDNCQALSYSDNEGLLIPHIGFWQRQFLVELTCVDLGISHLALKKHQKTFTP